MLERLAGKWKVEYKDLWNIHNGIYSGISKYSDRYYRLALQSAHSGIIGLILDDPISRYFILLKNYSIICLGVRNIYNIQR